MQIQSLSISAASHYQFSSISQVSSNSVAAGSADALEGTELRDPASTGDSATSVTRSAGFQQSLELIFRAQFEFSQQVEHGDRDHSERDMRQDLRDVRKAVKHEIKQLANQLAGIQTGDEGEVHGQDLKHEVKDIGKEFDKAIKQLEHDAHHGQQISEPGEVIEAIQSSFERLFSRIESSFGTQPTADAPEIDTKLPEALADFVDRIQTLISELSQSMASQHPEEFTELSESEEAATSNSELIPFGAPAQKAVSSYTSFSFELSISISGSSFSTAA